MAMRFSEDGVGVLLMNVATRCYGCDVIMGGGTKDIGNK
jgi:hypothetical protein